jgi:hypothetical protein
MNKKDKLVKRFRNLPHPANIIKGYVMRQVLSYLTTNGYLKEKED